MKPILLLMIVASAGCLHVQPIGPFADPAAAKKAVDESVPEPVVRQAGKPTPPALYVTPGEITSANAVRGASNEPR